MAVEDLTASKEVSNVILEAQVLLIIFFLGGTGV
jgi:hypothetical protein